MTEQSSDAANGIKDLEIGEERKTVRPRTHAENSSQVPEPAAATAAERRNPVKGILERRWRRKNDINGLHGLIREHSRLIAAMHSGRIGLEKGEILSRAYGRHREMVNAHELQTHLAGIEQQLKALRGQPSAQLLIDESQQAKELAK